MGASYAVMSVSVQQAAADGKHKARWPLVAALTHLTWRGLSRGLDNLHSCSRFDGWFHLTDLCCKQKKGKSSRLVLRAVLLDLSEGVKEPTGGGELAVRRGIS